MAAFPAVATVIGVSKEIAESGPLLATLAMDPGLMVQPPAPPMNLPEETEVEIKASDPVTQAVVDNIIGKLPTTKEQVRLKCEVCNIEVSGPEILQIHYAGSKHAKKLKAQELIKEIANSPNSVFVLANPSEGSVPNTKEFSCKICNVRLNSHLQLQQHLSGSKHKSKAEANKSNTVQVADTSGSNQGVVNVDIGPNRLYCAACNVHVNSDLQLHQHITSSKHAYKVNGKAPNNRGAPYARRFPTGKPWSRPAVGARPMFSGGWRPGRGGMFPQHMMPFHKHFMPGGTLSGYW